MRCCGFTSKEILLGILVVAVVAAVLIPVGMSMRGKDVVSEDVQRMRKLYMTLSIYESEWDTEMPDTLDKARSLVASTDEFVSLRDPYVNSSDAYPVDAGLPDFRIKAPSRISWTYVLAYRTAGDDTVPAWIQMKYQPNVPFLANEWLGSVKKEDRFRATVDGKIYRLNNDGALVIAERSAPSGLGNFEELFGKIAQNGTP